MMGLKVLVALTAASALLLPQCLSSEEGVSAAAPSPPLECSEVRNAFDARGIRVDWSTIPAGPMDGTGLKICSASQSCCTAEMEAMLGAFTTAQFKSTVERNGGAVVDVFRNKGKKIDDFVNKLIGDSQRQLHDVFTRTYGVLYERNSALFADYFRRIRSFYSRGDGGSLQEATLKFFTELYRKMFQVMNPQYALDPAFLSCVTRHMDEHEPFGDIPRKVASSVRRAVVAVRAMARALHSASDIADEMRKSPPSSECSSALQRMNTCPTCGLGRTELRPCKNFCLDVMNSCLDSHIEIQEQWDKFVAALSQLAERLGRAFNVETIILPLDINISDAIMSFQESGFQITQKVFDACGKPDYLASRSKREAEAAAAAAGNDRSGSGRAISLDDGNRQRLQGVGHPETRKELEVEVSTSQPIQSKGKSDFERMMEDLRRVVRNSQGFWRHMPYRMCLNTDAAKEGPGEKQVLRDSFRLNPKHRPLDDQHCWNGSDLAPYNEENAATNRLRASNGPSVFNEQLFKLQRITHQLKLAHEGNNVEWWDLGAKLVDTLHDDEDEYEGSGYEEGSGVGVDDDGEEDENNEGSGCLWDSEGSGECDDDEDCSRVGVFVCRPQGKPTTTTEAAAESTSEATTTADDITIDETTTAGAPSDGGSDGGSGATANSPLLLLPLLAALWLVSL